MIAFENDVVTTRASSNDRPRLIVSLFGVPLHPLLAPFPLVLITAAFGADVVYSVSENLFWQYLAMWLITGGLVTGGVATLVGVVDFVGDRKLRRVRTASLHLLLTVAAMALSLVNAFVHSRDGWTAVVPQGVFLSGVSSLVLLVGAWFGIATTFRHGAGVRP